MSTRSLILLILVQRKATRITEDTNQCGGNGGHSRERKAHVDLRIEHRHRQIPYEATDASSEYIIGGKLLASGIADFHVTSNQFHNTCPMLSLNATECKAPHLSKRNSLLFQLQWLRAHSSLARDIVLLLSIWPLPLLS